MRIGQGRLYIRGIALGVQKGKPRGGGEEREEKKKERGQKRGVAGTTLYVYFYCILWNTSWQVSIVSFTVSFYKKVSMITDSRPQDNNSQSRF